MKSEASAIKRYLLVAPALVVTVLGLVLPALAMLWWQLIGHAAWVLGKERGKVVGRYLGCYPFAYALLAWCHVVATFLWASDPKAGYRSQLTRVIDPVLDGLGDYPKFREIGGIW